MAEHYERIQKGIFRRGKRYYVAANFEGKTTRVPANRPDGRPAETITQVRAAPEILSGRVKTGHHVAAYKKRITISDLLNGLLESWNTAGPDNGPITHLKGRAGQVERVREVFGARRAREFGYKDAAAYVAEGKTPGQRSTRSSRMSMLKRAFSIGLRDGLVDKVPVFPERVDNVRQGYLTPEEFETHVAAFSGVDAQILRFAYRTGQRIQRVPDLHVTDVDTVDWMVKGEPTRGNKERPMVPLFGAARLVAEDRLKAAVGPDWLLFHRNGQRVTLPSIYNRWLRYMKKKGLRWTIHDFRRSAARNLVNSGVHPVVAKDLTGHKSLSMFSRYAINPTEALTKAAQQVDAYLADRLKDHGLESISTVHPLSKRSGGAEPGVSK